MNGRGASIPQNLLHDRLRPAPLPIDPGTEARHHVQAMVLAGQQDVAGVERKGLGHAARDTGQDHGKITLGDQRRAEVVQHRRGPLAPVGLFRPRPSPGRQAPRQDGDDQEEEQRQPVARLGHRERAERGHEQEVQGRGGQQRGDQRRPQAPQGGHGHDDDEVDQRNVDDTQQVARGLGYQAGQDDGRDAAGIGHPSRQ